MRTFSVRMSFYFEQKLHLSVNARLFLTQKSVLVTVPSSKLNALAPRSVVLQVWREGLMITLAIYSILGPRMFISQRIFYKQYSNLVKYRTNLAIGHQGDPFPQYYKAGALSKLYLIMKMPKIISLVGLPKRICNPVQFPVTNQTLQEIEMLKLAFRNSFAEHKVYSLGLSAPQIDVWKRFLIMPKNFLYGEIRDFKQLKYKVRHFNTYINPQIVEKSQEMADMNEYCLSIGFNQYKIRRPKYVEVKYYKEDGQLVQQKFDALRSRIIQHQIDHFQGILMSQILGAKMIVRGRAKKAQSEQPE